MYIDAVLARGGEVVSRAIDKAGNIVIVYKMS